MKDAKPTLKNAVLKFCHDCMGHYTDTGRDCKNVKCPLYVHNPYAKLKADLSWTKYNPKRSGLVLFADCEGREINENTKKALAKARNNRKKQ